MIIPAQRIYVRRASAKPRQKKVAVMWIWIVMMEKIALLMYATAKISVLILARAMILISAQKILVTKKDANLNKRIIVHASLLAKDAERVKIAVPRNARMEPV